MTGLAGAAVLVWAVAALGFSVVTLVSVCLLRRRVLRESVPPQAAWPAIAILRPCEGAEPDLRHTLLQTALSRYDGPRRVIVLLPSVTDPAYGEAIWARDEAARRGACAIEVRVTGLWPGGVGAGDDGPRNRKVAQLLRAGPIEEECVVQVDSDVVLSDRCLPALVSALLSGPGVGAAFAAPTEVGARGVWDRASAALVGASHQSFAALYALSRVTGGAPSLAGALCAFRRDALEAVGGYGPLQDLLGEDHEIARRLHAAGYAVRLSPEPARCLDGGRTAGQVVARVGRWMQVVRSQRGALLLTYPLLLAALVPLLGLSLLQGSPVLRGLVALLLVARVGLSGALLRGFGAAGERGARLWGRALRDALLAEGLMWIGLWRALTSRRVVWRGHHYRVVRGGRLVPLLGAQEP